MVNLSTYTDGGTADGIAVVGVKNNDTTGNLLAQSVGNIILISNDTNTTNNDIDLTEGDTSSVVAYVGDVDAGTDRTTPGGLNQATDQTTVI